MTVFKVTNSFLFNSINYDRPHMIILPLSRNL